MQRNFWQRWAGLGLVYLVSQAAWALDVTVSEAWAYRTLPNYKATIACLSFTPRQSGTLTGVRTSAARLVELHHTERTETSLTMRRLPRLALVAQQAITMRPDGLHMMLIGLPTPLASDSTFTLTLDFVDSKGQVSQQQVQAQVKAP